MTTIDKQIEYWNERIVLDAHYATWGYGLFARWFYRIRRIYDVYRYNQLVNKKMTALQSNQHPTINHPTTNTTNINHVN